MNPKPEHSSPEQPRHGLIAGGNFITDFVKTIGQWPEQDTLASIQNESMSNGGGPYNVLKDLTKIRPGMSLEACGLVGEDANGDWIVADCEAAGINVTQLQRTPEASTSYTDAMTVTTTGRRTFFHQRGANDLLEAKHFDFSQTRARIFLLGYLMLLDKLDAVIPTGPTNANATEAANVLMSARDAGLITAVDCVSEPSPRFRQVVLSALDYADIFFINEFEIGQVLGREVPAEKDTMLAAAKDLANECKNASTQIVLHAANGAVVVSKSGLSHVQGSVKLPQDEIKGASGAGDAFAAGYLIGIHDGEETFDCLAFAVCCAAQSLSDPSPSGGMKSLDECLMLGDRFGYRDF